MSELVERSCRTDNTIARSSTLLAMGPGWSSDCAIGTTPSIETVPIVGLQPNTPQKEAGRVIDPPVCDPIATGHMPAATAAADPLEEPPGVWARFHGLRVGGGSKHANCVVTVLPSITAPAPRNKPTSSASRPTGGPCVISGEPAPVIIPLTSTMSLMPIGIPCSGPRILPAERS